MTETYDSEDRRGAVDTRDTKVRKFGRNSEIEAELEREIKRGDRIHGKRIAGRQDITDIPAGLCQKTMPLPWRCDQCATAHHHYVMKCSLCGHPSPLARVNWRR